MKLRAISLTNVRKFTARRAVISGIGDGITLLSEPNEFGKSTFFDAIHALFFEKWGSTARAVKSLQPYAGGAVEVAAEIELPEGAFRVEKRFLARKMARVVRLSDGVTIAQDDEAERWIAQMLGMGDGPAGLLWVRQGLVGLEPDQPRDRALQVETRRDLLTSVAVEIDVMTGGRRMDRVMRRLAEDLAEIATKTGQKRGGWKAAADQVAALQAELAVLDGQVAALQDALGQRRLDEAQLARLDQPEAKARRLQALETAQQAHLAARAHAGLIATATQDRDIAALRGAQAQEALARFLAAIAGLATARTAAGQAADLARAALAEQTEVAAMAAKARAADDATRAGLSLARSQQDTARRQLDARKAKAEAAQLATQIDRAMAAEADLAQATAEVNASTATPEWLARAEVAASALARQEALLAAQVARLRIDYSSDLRLSVAGKDLAAGQDHPLTGRVEITLPGIGVMVIDTQDQGLDGAKALDAARQAYRLACGEAADLAAVRQLALQRADWLQKAELARAVLATLAPKGVAGMRAAKAAADLAAQGANDAPLPAPEVLQAAVQSAEDACTKATQARNAAERAEGQAREAAALRRAAEAAARSDLDRAGQLAGPEDQHDSRRAALVIDAARAADVLDQAASRLQDLQTAAPDLATITAELTRAQGAVTSAADQAGQLQRRLAAVSAQIETLAGNGIEARRDEVAGRLQTALDQEARLAFRAAALTRLQAALAAQRALAQETYLGPVQRELAPLLSILHRDAALSFDSQSLLPNGLARGQTVEDLQDLSGGTQEQIAVLTRLAFARLFAAQGRHLPIVLDDALVYSDDDRIIKMFTALTRVAEGQQIIVFSCRQLAFQDLGGARPMIVISEA